MTSDEFVDAAENLSKITDKKAVQKIEKAQNEFNRTNIMKRKKIAKQKGLLDSRH